MSGTAFSQLPLSPAQLQNLESLGYLAMTAIQQAALPLALTGTDLIAQAKTGSGKTATFALPMLSKINPRDFGTQALILCPTRELAAQVAAEIRRLTRHLQNIKVVTLVGGQSIGPQIGSLEHGAHIVVGTPGRIKDHLRKQTLSLARVETLVFDEADRMLEMGFMDDIVAIADATPNSRQTLLFSATYPEDIQRLSARFTRNAQEVREATTENKPLIEEKFYLCQGGRKREALWKILTHHAPSSVVIFCNTKEATRELGAYLQNRNVEALSLHGDMEQRDRDQVLIQFRQQSCRILVATDVAARGLDIDDLPAVINYDLPRQPEQYVHRIGRTGRAGRRGLSVSVVGESERFRLDIIGDYKNETLELSSIDSLPGNKDTLAPSPFTSLCISGGRKNKVRPGDILGALTSAGGISGKAVGKIEITEFAAYVAVERDQAGQALQQLRQGTIKGRKFKVRAL